MPFRVLLLGCLGALAFNFGQAETVHVLRAGPLQVEIACDTTALEADFGPRFDRTAYVRQVTLGTETFLTQAGLCDEFGLLGLGVLGFDEATAEETFLKIGVGSLRRGTGGSYRFSERYPVVETFPVEVIPEPHALVVRQATPASQRWAYTYEKRYALAPSGEFRIHYSLRNTGSAAFTFEHYNHNWLSFSGAPSGPEYRFRPAFTGRRSETAQWTFDGTELFPTAPLPERGGIHQRWDDVTGPAAIVVTHATRPHRLTLRGDFPLARFAAWANAGAISPELFYSHTLRPGETIDWTATYTFATAP